MTTEQSTTAMREDVSAERERLAAEAFGRIRKGNHWADWRFLAQGFEVGRNQAMRAAHTNEPVGRGYNEAFGRWMDEPARRTWTRGIDKATRNHLLWVADHLGAIEAWRETLPANQRDAWNHPTTVKKSYERAHRLAAAKEAGEAPAQSPMAQLKEALIESQERVARLERQVRDGGSLFDLHKDTAKDIGDLIVRECTPSRAESIAREIRAALKRRSAHAG